MQRVLRPQDGAMLGASTAVRDRLLIEAGGRISGFSLVEHLMPPRSLAAPLHRQSCEDEFSFVLEGQVDAHFDGVEAFANVGISSSSGGESDTCWNAGDAPARILEIIAPGGFEQACRAMHALGEALDPTAIAHIAVRYGVDVDFERTAPILARHGLTF